MGWPDHGNQAVQQSMKLYPDIVVGLAMIDLDKDDSDKVKQYADLGFRGLKVILPQKEYDHPQYFPIYEQATILKLPILFHTGIVGGGIDYLAEGISDNSSARAEEEAQVQELGRMARQVPYGRSSARMQPIFLDAIAIYFPELFMIGAHLGWPDYVTSCSLARWRPRLYFDISGGRVVRKQILKGRFIGNDINPSKIAFGSDCPLEYIGSEIAEWKDALDELGVSHEEQHSIFYGNAARIFGD